MTECGAIYPDLADHVCGLPPEHLGLEHYCPVCGLKWTDAGSLTYPA